MLIEVEEAHSRVAVTAIVEFQPARRVAAFRHDPLDAEMPGAGETLNVEPHIGVTAANPLPRLWRLINDVLGDQASEGVPVPAFSCGPVGGHHLVRIVHGLNLLSLSAKAAGVFGLGRLRLPVL